MLPAWLLGLYPPAKDIARGVTNLRSRGVAITIEAHAQGPRTWIIVTAQCKLGGKPLPVRGCWAEIYTDSFHACIPAQPVRTRVITFRPGGPLTIRPGEPPIRWEAQVLNEYVRRAAHELDTVSAIEAFGEKRGREEIERREVCLEKTLRDAILGKDRSKRAGDGGTFQERHPLRALLAELVAVPEEPAIRAVIEPIRGESLVTEAVDIPPPAPFPELLNAYLTARRARNATKEIKEEADLKTGSIPG